jgi:hypothetical protein
MTINDLNICGIENGQILWQLALGGGVFGSDGYCDIQDGQVQEPQLCEDRHVDLKPSAIKEIQAACQEWLDEKPQRDQEARDWDNRYEYYKGLWEDWENHENIEGRHYQVCPSIYHEPTEIAVQGECYFIAYDEEGTLWRSASYNNPTWADVLRALEDSLEHTQDYHHVYLEGIMKSEFDGEYYFTTGS